MTKRLLQQLVLASYHKDHLSPNIVDEISGRLDRKDLKAYLRALKLMEQQKKIYIAMPKSSVYNTSKKELEKLYPGKDIVFTEDPSLLLGLQLVDNDMVYEMSLQHTLETVLEEVDQQYND